MRPLALLLLGLCACGPKTVPVAAAPVPAPPAPVDMIGPKPVVAPPAPWSPPTPEVVTLANGAPVWVVHQPSLPLVTVVLTAPGGASTDPAGKEGTAWLSNRMMLQGAGKLDATRFAETADRLGLQLSVETGRAVSTISLSGRRDVVEQGLDLVADMLLRPTYASKDFEREKGLAVTDLTAEQDDIPAVAAKLAWRQWYGPAHPYARPSGGTVAGMKAVSLKEAKAAHTAIWTGGFQFSVGGSLTAAEARTLLESRFGAAARKPTAAPPVPPAPAHTGKVYLVDKPGSAQTMFYWMFPGVGMASAELPAIQAGTVALGGTFTSRLNQLLREKKGYTYGARAAAQALPAGGALVVTSRIRTDVTAEAWKDFVGEFQTIQNGISSEELGKAQGAFRQDQVEAMETRAGVAAAFATYQGAGLGPGALAADLTAMQALDLAAVKGQMGRYAREGGILVLVGDRAKIEAPLKAAGIGEIELLQPL